MPISISFLKKVTTATVFILATISFTFGTPDARAMPESDVKAPSIDFGKDRCALCNMLIREKKFTASLVSEKNILAFDDIGDLLIYYKANKDESYTPWVYDYYSEKSLKAESAFFVISKSVKTPMGHGIIAFEKDTEAISFKEKNDGEYFKGFSELFNHLLNNPDKFKNFDKHSQKMNMSSHSHNHNYAFRGQPIGIMGAHIHDRNSLMASYRFMYMNMQNNLSGTQIVTKEEILKNFMIAPQNMSMYMHMAGIMYSLTDEFTIMGMLPFTAKSMQSEIKMSQTPAMGTMAMSDTLDSMSLQGFGDFRLDGLYNILRNENHSLIARVGLSLPTGSINIKSDGSMGKDKQLPYPMQLGSGTYDLLAGLTYSSGIGEWTWGGQLNGNIRLGKNSNNYTLGNIYNFTTWGGRRLLPWLHSFLRINLDNWGNISGKDSLLDEKMTPAARNDLRAGTRADLLVGINFILPEAFGMNNLGVEFGLPVYQNLTGPQTANSWYINSGLQHLF